MPAHPAVGDPGTDTVSTPNDWASEQVAFLGTTLNLSTGNIKAGAAAEGTLTFSGATAATQLSVADFTSVATAYDRVSFSNTMWNPGTGRTTTLKSTITAKGLKLVSDGAFAARFLAQDHSSVAIKTVTNATRVGTTVTVTASSHGFANNDKIQVYDITHTFNAEVNGEFTISNVTTNTFDYTVAGLSSGSYTSGGSATNRPYIGGLLVEVSPRVVRNTGSRASVHADDAVGVAVSNISGVSSAKGTDAYYVSRNATFTGDEWTTAYNSDANVQIGYRLAGLISVAGIDLRSATWGSATTPGLLLPNARSISWRNAADGANIEGIQLNSSNRLIIMTTAQLADGVTVVLGTGTGTSFGSAANQKVSLHGATPVIQHATTGVSAGFTAGAGTTVTHLSTFTGNTGSTAYTIGDIVKMAKDKGLMAA